VCGSYNEYHYSLLPPPRLLSGGESDAGLHGYSVYSCGDGVVLEHRPDRLDTEAANISTLINQSNPDYRVRCSVFSAHFSFLIA